MFVIKPLEVTDSTLVSSNVPEDDHDEWVIGTSYVVGDKVIVLATHKIYEALINNVGMYPPDYTETVAPEWLDLGATNRWKMLDQVAQSKTEVTTMLDYSFLPGVIVNSVALLGITATTAQIILTDPVEGEVYNETYELHDPAGVLDWYLYFFSPVVEKTDLVVKDLPPYPDATLRIVLASPSGEAVACGVCGFNVFSDLGCTQFGFSSGIKDYSRKEVDDFGNATVVVRSFSEKISCDIELENGRVDQLSKILTDLRSTPAIWVGSQDYDATVVYGFYIDFSIIINNGTLSMCSLEILGLT